MLALLLALSLAAAPGGKPPASGARGRAPDPLDRRREAIAEQIVKLGARVQRELEAGNVEGLLARVPAGGLRCAERVVPRARVARDLHDPRSWLRESLLGPSGRPPRGPPRSLRAFFASAREVAVLVSFRRDARSGPVGLPCLEYRARDVVAPIVPLCFERARGRWWLAESLYPCG